ncbi:unnamed protein product [Porites lobata]|uniref:RING-type domain-containing protein n=1 Tax=Porites lobata TaxID=104759 RepID=A0ABN8PTE2_9CNID|nr:unnamed protein product [Porites lobata]
MVDNTIAALFSSFEQRFNCLICWAPSLRMIYGSCQHRLCENCLYDNEGKRRLGLERCPTCQRENVFPSTRPDVPEDNIEIQVHLGVRRCPHNGCKLQMWHWELQNHLEICRFASKSLDRTKKVKRKSLYDSEVNKPLTLRSGKRRSLELTHNKSMDERETMYKLRPRKRKTVTN